jgi:hypothetical protein
MPDDVSSRALEELAADFRKSRITHADWTHSAHLRVAAWHVDRFGRSEALERLRVGIRRLNDHHGTPNSETRGYHETITVAYVHLIGHFLATCPAGTTLATRAAELLASPLGAKNALLRHWTAPLLMSPAARAAWVAPDLMPLPELPPDRVRVTR